MNTNSAIVYVIFIIVAGFIFYPLVSKWWDAEIIKTKYDELPVEQRDIVKAVDELKACKKEKKEIEQFYKDTIAQITKTFKTELAELEGKKDSEKDKAMQMLKKAYDQKIDTVASVVSNKIANLNKKLKSAINEKNEYQKVYRELEAKSKKLEKKLKQSYNRVITLYRDSLRNAQKVIPK